MQNRKNIAAARIADKCNELSNLATLHGLDTLALVLSMGVLEAKAHAVHASEAHAGEDRQRADADAASVNAPRIVGCWNWDIASNKIYGTRQFAAFYNIDPRLAAAGAPIELMIEAIHPLDQNRVADAIETAVRTGDDYEIEYRVIGKDQAIRWVRARGRCWRDEEDRPLHFPGSLIDITHEKRIRAA
ncbi:PAS domain-containing protein [Bradyrhizobium prioriisuperbiae]|uniref:PAS domain-containing protein n=1 Tax=Bradyrhizobium prioriisuperbiae TaxID=2854389 RepID=UPI0028EE09FC|nr:PAS domain-containing protein [Bradyrhizobium prioritasuperba]